MSRTMFQLEREMEVWLSEQHVGQNVFIEMDVFETV